MILEVTISFHVCSSLFLLEIFETRILDLGSVCGFWWKLFVDPSREGRDDCFGLKIFKKKIEVKLRRGGPPRRRNSNRPSSLFSVCLVLVRREFLSLNQLRERNVCYCVVFFLLKAILMFSDLQRWQCKSHWLNALEKN